MVAFPEDPREPDPADLLELEVDLRLLDLIVDAWREPEWGEALIAGYLRLAFAAGYLDALREPRPGELCRRHGLPVPRPRLPGGA